MGYIRPGKVWRMLYGGMPASIFLVPDATLNPVGGDLCNYVNAKPSAIPTSSSPTTEQRTIRFICAEGRSEVDILNNPGYTAGTSSVVGRVRVGANRSRVPDATSKIKPFIPVTDGLQWVMQRRPASGSAPVVGQAYGLHRDGTTNNQTFDTAVADDVITVLAIYEPDYLANGAAADQYWVKAALPGGYV